MKLSSIASSAWARSFAVCSVLLPACSLQNENLGAAAAPTTPGPTGGRTGGRPQVVPPGSPRIDPPPSVLSADAAVDPAPPPAAPPPVPAPGGFDAASRADGSGSTDAAVDRAPPPPSFSVAEVATWRGGALGAYSIVHGSVCDGNALGAFKHADPELTRRGLRAGFSVIVTSCGPAPGDQWPKVKALAEHGHDIINHSYSFACLAGRQCAGRRASLDFAFEIDQATDILQKTVAVPVRYFAFPFDACGPEAIAHLRQRGYLGARCGGRGVTEPKFADGFASKSDVWGPAFSIYAAGGPCAGLVRPNTNQAPESLPPACRTYVLNQYVDDAIAQRGWAVRTLTGFLDDPGAFQPISVPDYTAHLDYIKARSDAGQLWVEGPTPIVKYRWAREACPLPTVEGNTLRFSVTPDCRPFTTTLSYVVTSASAAPPETLKVTQAGATRPVKTLSKGRYLVDADPSKGDATLTP